MEAPQFVHTWRDEKKNVTVRVSAYRQLTDDEVRVAVRQAVLAGGLKLKKHRIYEITTSIGARDSVDPTR